MGCTRHEKQQARILVVDGEQSAALALSAVLEEQGYAVATAFNGEEAIEKAVDFIPDLLVSEVYIGAINGIQAAIRIRTMLPECRVLFLSRRRSISDILNAAPRRLAYSFMPRPMHPLDLLNTVAYMVSAVATVDEPDMVTVEHDASLRYANGLRTTSPDSYRGKQELEPWLLPQHKECPMPFSLA